MSRVLLIKSRHRLFLEYLLSYLLIVSLTLIFFVIAFTMVKSILLENLREQNDKALVQASRTIDRLLNDTDKMIQQISSDPALARLLITRSPLENEKAVLDFKQYYQNLTRYNLVSGIVDAYYIYIKYPEVVMTDTQLYLRPQFFFGEAFSIPGVSRDSWIDYIFLTSNQKRYLPAADYAFNLGMSDGNSAAYRRYISIIYPLSAVDQVNRSVIQVFISEQTIQSNLASLNLGSTGFVIIADDQERIITSKGQADQSVARDLIVSADVSRPYRIGDETYVLSMVSSQEYGWHYISATPASVVFARLDLLSRGLFMGIAVFLIVSILLSYLLTYQNLKPINRIFRKAFAQTDDSTSLDKLEQKVEELVDRNRTYEYELKNQANILKTSLCERILSGDLDLAARLTTSLSMTGEQIELDPAALLVLTFIGVDEGASTHLTDAVRMNLKANIAQVFNTSLMLDADYNQISVIIPLKRSDDSAGMISSGFDRISRAVNDFSDGFFRLFAVASPGYSDLGELHRVHKHMQNQCDYAIRKNIAFSVYMDSQSHADRFFYPIEFEMNLINTVCAGNRERTRQMIAQIFSGISKRSMTAEILQTWIAALKVTASRVYDACVSKYPGYQFIDEATFHRSLGRIHESLPVSSSEKKFLCLLDQLTEVINDAAQRESSSLVQAVLDYIHQHYQNPNLSLALLSDLNHVSEPYLSRLFKAQVSKNYYDYLAEIRISKACHDLKKTEDSINDIALQVGYNSPQVFRRTFKKITGVTPNEFRQFAEWSTPG